MCRSAQRGHLLRRRKVGLFFMRRRFGRGQLPLPGSPCRQEIVPGAQRARHGRNAKNVLNEGARAFLAPVLECSDDAIITKTLDGIISSWNKGAERIFGYRAEEIIGQPTQADGHSRESQQHNPSSELDTRFSSANAPHRSRFVVTSGGILA